MKKLIILAGALLVSLGLAGCNTVKGFGKDISKSGQALSTAATNVQSDHTKHDAAKAGASASQSK